MEGSEGPRSSDFVKWREVQVLDPVLSIIYDWVENNLHPK